MVVDTTYYDALEISPNANELEIKKAYRKMAIRHHPDKNPDDETAHERFQAIGEAYQVLSDKDLRKRYDQFGKDQAVPDSGFEDPAEFFTTIFGGEAFADLIGEISLIKDLTKTMEIASLDEEEGEEASKDGGDKKGTNGESNGAVDEKFPNGQPPNVPGSPVVGGGVSPAGANSPSTSAPAAAATAAAATAASATTPSTNTSTTSSAPPTTASPAPSHQSNFLSVPAITSGDDDARSTTSSTKEKSKKDKDKKSKTTLTKEQKAELEQYEIERQLAKEERISTLTAKLIDRISVWTETDKGEAVTKAFTEKTRIEAENLKMESFGIELLHAIGYTYYTKGSILLKSQKFLGVSGFFSKLKEKGTQAKDTWNTISSALDAQSSLQEMAKAEEKGGDDWTEERRVEMERTLLGKVLAAAWNGSRYEIQAVLREVCDRVLNDKSVPYSKRLERAQALKIIGNVFKNTFRTAEEAQEAQMFEELVAEAAASKKKKKDKYKPPTSADSATATTSDSASAAATAAATAAAN